MNPASNRRSVAGALDAKFNVATNNQLADAVVKNDKQFLGSFPDVAHGLR